MGDFDQQTQMKHGFSHIQWMQNFYAQNMYSDIELIIKNKRYAVHKSILHMASALFRRLLNDYSRVLDMPTEGIREISVSKAIEFLYKGTIAELQVEQIANILKLAQLWQLDKLKDYCYLFVEGIFRDNSQVSQRLGDIDNYFIKNFSNITTNIRFLNLSVENVKQILSSDNLYALSEEQVFKGLSQWVKHDWINRKKDLYSLLKCIRLPCCSVSFLLKEVRSLCCESVEECQLLLDAILWHQFPQNRSSLKLMNSGFRNFDRRVLIVGGGYYSNTPSLIEMYNTITNSWTNFLKIDINIKNFSAETFQNNLIIFGGWDTKENRLNDKVYSFNLHTKQLTDLAPMNKEKYDATSVIINKRIFVIGGYNEGSVDTVEEYNIIENSWKNVASMKKRRRNHASVVYKGKIYVFGGTSSFNLNDLSSVEVYNPNANRWTELSPMKWKRRNFPAVVVNDSIYCIGGVCGSKHVGQVEKFDPRSNSWTEVSEMPVKDYGFQAIYQNEKIICFGGLRNSKIQVYDPAKNTWEIIGECPNQRAFYVALILERSF
ncbi:kelch-like protein 5 [Arctopsyche grandis]|uniref:kelch-like protein 5 n=1 Tax=Arctopsyche grandis TaxID=121162 RepID=UPI00406D9CE2